MLGEFVSGLGVGVFWGALAWILWVLVISPLWDCLRFWWFMVRHIDKPAPLAFAVRCPRCGRDTGVRVPRFQPPAFCRCHYCHHDTTAIVRRLVAESKEPSGRPETEGGAK